MDSRVISYDTDLDRDEGETSWPWRKSIASETMKGVVCYRFGSTVQSLNRDFGRGKREKNTFRKESLWVDDSQLENQKFEAYYKRQGIISEEEWNAFQTAARTELPVVFRINGRGPRADELRRKLEADFFEKLANVNKQDSSVAAPKPLEWYPDHLAWQFAFSRRELRRDPAYEPLHEYIKQETAVGNISRQEAVSMIPPLVLDVQSHHRVLDMCAAPGSKTAQLLEILHGDQSTQLPAGFIMANDLDFQRCNMMTHQVKRMVSPNILVTSADASSFPTGAKITDDRRALIEFDRILADVPCSGDGTTRKNPEMWRKWKLHSACGLHPLQLRIALRGVKLLAVGGLLAYSTCSLNPIENEAVVAEVCRRTQGAMELVDLSSRLPELVSRPGLSTWIVQDDHREYGSYAEAVEHRNETKKKLDIDPTFFPPTSDEKFPLERCLRLLPHLSDSGGFFVALFKKIKQVEEIPVPSVQHRVEGCSESERREHRAERDLKLGKEQMGMERSPEADPNPRHFKGIDPVIDMDRHAVTREVTEFYGLHDFQLGKNLISRNLNNDEPRKAYFISTEIKELIASGWDKSIRITSLGQQVLTRAFQRKEGSPYQCIYRFNQEGLPLVLPYITKQKLFLKKGMLKRFLTEKTIKIQHPDRPESDEGFLVKDQEVIEGIRSLEQGGCIVMLDDSDAADLGLPLSTEAGAGLTARAPLAVSAWLISPYCLNLMVQKEDLASILQRLGDGEDEEGGERQAAQTKRSVETPTEEQDRDSKKSKLVIGNDRP